MGLQPSYYKQAEPSGETTIYDKWLNLVDFDQEIKDKVRKNSYKLVLAFGLAIAALYFANKALDFKFKM